MAARRTQAERRETTRTAVLDSAIRLFGRKGYADTNLDEIAAEAGVTVRPIYHYFGSKRELFEATIAVMEERVLATFEPVDPAHIDPGTLWRAFLDLCADPEFRRILLVEGPKVLGRDRWASSPVSRAVQSLLREAAPGIVPTTGLALRMLVAALTEAALAIAESPDPQQTSREAEALVDSIFGTRDAQRGQG